METEAGFREAKEGSVGLAVVADTPARGDVAVLRGGRVRWTVVSRGGLDTVLAAREETFRDGGFQVKFMLVTLPAWRDLVLLGACSVSRSTDEEIKALLEHAE